ncbi:hypothetical protein ACIOZM_02535 [Pseudomonas sp. NPDC087346]|uniref:hypothetical protein n=1 Tax=Pseudomonas sp. NPDC087346 TaxID=3364438 RepID=UPI00380F24EE
MQITRTGTVLTGEHAGWTMSVHDDSTGETGGYFLYLLQGKLNGFDSWFETIEQLEREISELHVRWD